MDQSLSIKGDRCVNFLVKRRLLMYATILDFVREAHFLFQACSEAARPSTTEIWKRTAPFDRKIGSKRLVRLFLSVARNCNLVSLPHSTKIDNL